jgi:methyl acetate hydrolase
VGQVIEAITGRRLGEVFKTLIFEPLGMKETTFELTDTLREPVAGSIQTPPSFLVGPASKV